MAELAALARGERWTDQGFLGFPVHLLHSPLAYGLLARLVASGVPIGLVYGSALLAGVSAPSLAIYRMARARWPVVPSALLAVLVLVHPNALVGYGATTGGMWTFGLAAGALLLLMERVARAPRGPADVLPIAALLGLVAWLHPMITVCAILLAGVSVVLRLGRPRELLAALPYELGAAALGAAVSSAWWLPTLLSGQGTPLSQQSLTPLAVLLRLLFPTDLDELWRGTPGIDTSAYGLDAIPMVLLVAGGLVGAVRGWRHSPLVRLAATYAAVLLALLLLVTPWVQIPALGPLTWRFVWIVQLSLAVCALGLEPAALPSRPGRSAVVALAASLLSSFPLARAVPSTAEMADVYGLWVWLRVHREEIDGRVYLQSTLGTPPLDGGLATSQVLARTAEETGVDQVGTWYGISPYPTGRWTPGEFGRLFRQPATEKGLERILLQLTRAACSHVVVSNPELVEPLVATGALVEVHRVGRFVVLAYTGPHDRVVSSADRLRAEVDDHVPGKLVVRLGQGVGPVVLSQAWHPYWTVEGRGELTPTPDFLQQLTVPPGPAEVVLRYRPPLELGWTSLLTLALMMGGAVAQRRRR